MNPHPQFELVSFSICPYVQRSVVTLLHKKVDFKLSFIDLGNPPDWFNKISPLGKVPVLLIRKTPNSEPAVLFESAVINEYIDEVTPPSLFPKDPLEKARQRAWVAVGGELLMTLYTLMTSSDSAELSEANTDLWEVLDRVEEAVTGKGVFSNTGFSLVDAAFAPVFMRLMMMRSLRKHAHWKDIPKTRLWAETLLALPEVQRSVTSDFQEQYLDYLTKLGSPAAHELQV